MHFRERRLHWVFPKNYLQIGRRIVNYTIKNKNEETGAMKYTKKTALMKVFYNIKIKKSGLDRLEYLKIPQIK